MARRRLTGTGGGARGALANRGGPIGVELVGLEELERTLGDVAPRVAYNIMRNTVVDMARDVRDEMKRRVPKDTGTLRKAIKAYRPRARPPIVEAHVYITHGKNVKYDAYYWHFLEWGTVKEPAQPFLTPSVEAFRQRQPRIMREKFGKQYEKAMQRLAKKGRKR